MVAQEFATDDWEEYRMDYRDPFRELEPEAQEREVVGEALRELRARGILGRREYSESKLAAHRRAVRRLFEVPWTAITPRMERLLYALNAIHQPARMIAAGVFCGFTFICNAGAAVGPGACYGPRDLVGVEIKPQEAERAERNVRRIDADGRARVVAEDAVGFVAGYPHAIDLLYLDADGAGGRGKAVYLDILRAGYDRLSEGALVLAHNSQNSAQRLAEYLDFVRDPAHFSASLNIVFDREGLEVSARG